MTDWSATHLTEHDLYLFNEGSNYRLYHKFGAHPCVKEGVAGTNFAVWAPLATPVRDEPVPVEEPPVARDEHVGMIARAAAGAIDLLLLGGIDLLVVWLTVRLCALTFGQALTLPLVPLVAFCLLVDVGYLLLFTATTGQTLGKMAAGLRVVGAAPDAGLEPLSLRQAIVRSLATVPSVVALGAGFIPALGGDGLAVHDRLAHTRVVRA